MKTEEKIGVLSEALSRHIRNLRKLGGMYSLSAIEEQHEDGYKCEINFSGLRQQGVTVTKKSKEEAGEDIASVLTAILREEVEVLDKIVAEKSHDAEAIRTAVKSCEDEPKLIV